MIKSRIKSKTTLKVNSSYEGERIEDKVNRILNNNEPIKDGAPIIYTERKDGVRPEYDIRTDRFEVAMNAMEIVHKTELAKRQQRIDERNNMKVVGGNNEQKDSKGDGGAESVGGTSK